MENRHYQNGSDAWLIRSLFESTKELLGSVRVLEANQSANKADLLTHFRVHAEHTNQRLDDLRDSLVPRLESNERMIREVDQRLGSVRLDTDSMDSRPSTAESLFGPVGAYILENVPWKHVMVLASGALFAAASHLLPEQVWTLLAPVLTALSGGAAGH